jgi:hypothetical protein
MKYDYYADKSNGEIIIVSNIGTTREFQLCTAIGENEANFIVACLNYHQSILSKFNIASDRLAWKTDEMIDNYEHANIDKIENR